MGALSGSTGAFNLWENFPQKLKKPPKIIINSASFSITLSLSSQSQNSQLLKPLSKIAICSCNWTPLLDLLLQFSVTHLTIAICSFLSLLPDLVFHSLPHKRDPQSLSLSFFHKKCPENWKPQFEEAMVYLEFKATSNLGFKKWDRDWSFKCVGDFRLRFVSV